MDVSVHSPFQLTEYIFNILGILTTTFTRLVITNDLLEMLELFNNGNRTIPIDINTEPWIKIGIG